MPKLVYVKAKPVTVENLLSGPRAVVRIAGRLIDQPICQAPDDGAGIPVWAAVVDDETHAAIAAEPEFLGAGLTAVQVKDPAVFDLVTVQEVADPKAPGGNRIVGMGEKVAVGDIVVATRPAHTFAGWDPMTGDPVPTRSLVSERIR
ncbi:MAG: hypothetical protein C4529_13015 [Deltaproteobacteria bacterium]|nr:MAG: hypothetical protein C4529_13015 [Deltaproteobacteria bacterium]